MLYQRKARRSRTAAKASAAILSISMIAWGCGAPTSPSTSNGQVALSIQGTKPVSSSLRTALRSAASNLSSVTSSTELPVKNSEGTQIGTLTLTDARIVLQEIMISEEIEDEEGDDESEEEENENEETDSEDESDFDEESDDEDEASNEEEFEDEDEDENYLVFEGPFIVNLLTNEVTPSLETLDLPAGTYFDIEFYLDRVDGDELDENGNPVVDASDNLYGKSIYLEGTYTGLTASGQVENVPFTYSYDGDDEFELSNPAADDDGMIVNEEGGNPFVIAFRLADWFDFEGMDVNGLDFADIEVENGRIDIDDTDTGSEDDLRDLIWDCIESSVDYGEDEDGDGELDEDEDHDFDEEDDVEDEDSDTN